MRQLLATVAIASVLAVALTACGSSSNSSSATNSAGTKQTASRSSRFTSVRACLEKAGIKLPARPTGQSGGGGLPGAGRGDFKLPEGVSRSEFREALNKCGGGFPRGARRSLNSAAAKAALTQFAACMRENGVNLPAPNTSGAGPVFNTKGIDTSSEAFKKARQKCQGKLGGAFDAGRPPGGPHHA
ncbi:MAG TPA: hypothetical protein VID29_04530 [Solirubrobacteraceae bacterium]